LVVGDQEMENREVAVRTRDGIDLGKMKIDDFATKVKQQISLRSLKLLEE
jgi:threonyl-tRNA synthetase